VVAVGGIRMAGSLTSARLSVAETPTERMGGAGEVVVTEGGGAEEDRRAYRATAASLRAIETAVAIPDEDVGAGLHRSAARRRSGGGCRRRRGGGGGRCRCRCRWSCPANTHVLRDLEGLGAVVDRHRYRVIVGGAEGMV